jgi:Uma2 family endonuclease
MPWACDSCRALASVEVVSPDDTFHEVQEKALEWFAAGVIVVLVLDPSKRTATVYGGQGDAHVHDDGDTLDLSDAVPELPRRGGVSRVLSLW